jgi:N,N-dimethylformamidase
MQPIIGYCDPWSARPGERIRFMISSAGNRGFVSRVQRVIHVDPNPAGPGIKLREAAGFVAGRHDGLEQPARIGSCAVLPAPKDLGLAPFHLVLNIKPAASGEKPSCVAALLDRCGTEFVVIGLAAGQIVALQQGGPEAAIATGIRLEIGKWYALAIGFAPGSTGVEVAAAELNKHGGFGRPVQAQADLASPLGCDWSRVSIGAQWRDTPTLAFDGYVERPSMARGTLPDLAALGGALGVAAATSLACWDFSRGIDTQRVEDVGPNRLSGLLKNLPTRGLRGSNWSGREMAWRHAPAEYGAICFHSDDVGDCEWQTSVDLEIPAGAESGVYALHVVSDAGEDRIPFYVLPPKTSAARRQRPRVVYLAPTLTYLAYANHARDNLDETFRGRIRDWAAYPHNPDDVREFGFSTYNYHPGGLGVSLSSRRRPVLTMRPGYLTFNDQAGSGLRHFSADSHLTDWLDHFGIDFDVVTDEDLDDEGIDLIRDYDVLLTGSHPEYYTGRMLDALHAYRELGKNLVYLGGNGFYWKIARRPDLPHVMEIRRAESGIRAWASDPGEYYNQLDGAYGGLWRRNGQPPQALAEIGFAVQGFFEGAAYHRTPESRKPAHAWLFEGVKEDVFGGYGLSGGGAAGFELDQISTRLGTDPRTVLLARSAGHGPSFLGVPEDILTHVIAASAGRVIPEAHLVYGCNDAGGQIVSVGSITFLGSLSHNNYDNDISRLLSNVVAKFSLR